MSQIPRIISKEELPASDARWVTLQKITFTDQEGRQRLWEAAERKTRGSSGVDAVAILAIMQPKDKSPPATIIIEQFRPPVEKFAIGGIQGLIDEGETPEDAAFRELEEETGFVAEGIIESSPLMVSDPGMTSANMKLVTLRVPVDNAEAYNNLPKQVLDSGEFIVRRVIKLDKLHEELEEYSRKGFVVDARLSHFAIGYNLSSRLARGDVL
ncbi:NUDIX hydrolase domain-like protein [Hysterangium stoloniferum]|nr:NUDIX hydrolase domain-like protein [Hysterangium stoloniferum]